MHVARPLKFREQLLNRNNAAQQGRTHGSIGVGRDHLTYGALDFDGHLGRYPVAQPVVDVAGGALTVHAKRQFGLSAADLNSALERGHEAMPAQESLCKLTANYLVSQGCKIPCMKIGEVVAELMTQEGLSQQALAQRVREAGAKQVRYQHIQQLLASPDRKPRYMLELARAFGMSVEELVTWKPGASRRSTDPAKLAPVSSQSEGQDPAMLASAYQLARLACKALRLPFDPETAEDANIVLLGQTYLIARGERIVTPDNLVDFQAYLQNRIHGQQEEKGRGRAGSAGRGARRQGAGAG